MAKEKLKKLYYKGKEISSEDAHKLDANEKAFLEKRGKK